jgi:hypothetical protein
MGAFASWLGPFRLGPGATGLSHPSKLLNPPLLVLEDGLGEFRAVEHDRLLRRRYNAEGMDRPGRANR